MCFVNTRNILKPGEETRNAVSAIGQDQLTVIFDNQTSRNHSLNTLVIHPCDAATSTILFHDLFESCYALWRMLDIDQDTKRKSPVGEIVEL